MDSNSELKKVKLKIHGMHCASCEVLIERKFKKIAGVEKVRVSHYDGKAIVYCSSEPDIAQLHDTVKNHGYAVTHWADRDAQPITLPERNTGKDYLHIGAIFLIVTALYLILKRFDLVPSLGIADSMSYGFIFLIGLVAAVSTCMAVTGGLLIAVAAKYNERHPELTGKQRFKPHLYFNIGRVVSYTVLGGVIGALGSVIALSTRTTGIVTIVASVAMIILGLQLLKLFPWLSRLAPKMPKFIAHRVHELSTQDRKAAPFILGASTFLLPCGFTQALQLYVLSQGDWKVGALTMLAFSLGTLPALLSLSVLSSFAKGSFQRYFLKVSGVLVILLGIFNVQNGITLAGATFSFPSFFKSGESGYARAAEDPNVKIVDGKQIVDMQVTGLSYYPYQFTVAQGVPVEWRIDGSRAQGCAQVISIPKLGIVKYLSPSSPTVISFTPQETGSIAFSCTMGMTTRGSAFNVVPNTTGIVGAKTGVRSPTENTAGCNPEIANCVEAQRLSMEISRERGFYPRSFTVKKGVPVELTIDDQVPLGGCMSVMVIPQYNVATPIRLGQNRLAFTPTRTGVVPITCSMGSRMAQIVVTD